jgi:hypothetical protein
VRVKIIVRLIPDSHCSGCGAHGGYVEERTGLCLHCLSLHIIVEGRKQKLQSTLAYRFATLKQEIREKLKAFQN